MATSTRVAVYVFAIGVFVVVLLSLSLRIQQPVMTAAYEIEHDPLTISVSTIGRFAQGIGSSWHLHVNSDGAADLKILSFPAEQRRFHVPKEQFVTLRRALLAEHFFDLKDEYGQHVSDGSTQTISISAGNRTKTVKLHYLMNWVHDDKAKLREPRRAVKVLLLIRDWFEDPHAVDLRRYNRMVVEG